MKSHRAMPILLVKDIEASVAFYGALGFACHGFWGDPPGFAVVQRGKVTIGLNRMDPPGRWPKDAWAAYVYISDADALHEEFSRLDLHYLSDLRDQPYGCREFEIEDCDGYRIAFGQDVVDHDDGPGLGPDAGRG